MELTSREKVRDALDNNRTYELLMGSKGYEIIYPENLNLDMPEHATDWDELMMEIHNRYCETNDENIAKKFEEALLKMIKNSNYSLWRAVYAWWTQLEMENQGLAKFEIHKNLCYDFLSKIYDNEEKLKQEKIMPESETSPTYYEDIERIYEEYLRKWGKLLFIK